MSIVNLNLPDDLATRAQALAEAAGISLADYIATALTDRIAAEDDVRQAFAARAARAIPGRARAVLSRAGMDNPPVPGDEIPSPP